MYHFINGMVGGSLGDSQLFPRIFAFIFTLFFFIASCNLFGITPYSYTVTSQIVVTFTIALISFLLVVFLGIKTHGLFGFIHMFAPKGVPMFMLPLIFLIELFSFLIRPVTLAVRLFANMVAGHVLLKVVAGFIIALGLAGVFPFLFTILLIGFEVFVAILQAYIFSILVCAYLGEVVKEH